MKVKIGKHTSWFGPHQLAEKLCFWVGKEVDEYGFRITPEWVHNFGEWLAYGNVEKEPKVGETRPLFEEREPTKLFKFLSWIESKKSRTIKVQIDPYDSWNADETLAYIILPVLKQLRDTFHGSPITDDEDAPAELSGEDSLHERWHYILNEMIFAFDCKVGDNKDWELQFHSPSEEGITATKEENGNFRITGIGTFDAEGHEKYYTRIRNGYRLFGKYYDDLRD